MFLPFVGCLFTVLIVSSVAKQVLILMMSSLSTFILLLVLLVPYIRKYYQIQGHKDLLVCFLLKAFVVLALTFSSFVYLWVKFYRWCKVRGQVHSFPCESLFVSAPFVEKTSFHYWMVLAPLLSELTMSVRVSFWTLNSIPLIYMPILRPIPHFHHYCSSVASFETGMCESSKLVFLKIYLSIYIYVCVCVCIYIYIYIYIFGCTGS